MSNQKRTKKLKIVDNRLALVIGGIQLLMIIGKAKKKWKVDNVEMLCHEDDKVGIAVVLFKDKNKFKKFKKENGIEKCKGCGKYK